MRYGSVCSGIEAASVAWESLGWQPAFFSEIETFPRAVLQYHYPHIPLHGDFTTIKEQQYGPIDLLVGGTPCQSFSVAGLRSGLDDERGNLALEYLKLAQRKRPRWLVWENVPGVLSSSNGKDFGAFIGGLVELGYGYAYATLDAQHFGVPQRRKRVFVVGYLGDWRPAAAVLFERESLRRDPPPSREAAEDVAGTLTSGLDRRRGAGQQPESLVSCHRVRGFGDYTADSVGSTLKARDHKDSTDPITVHGTQDPDTLCNLAHTLGRNGGREYAIAFDTTQITSAENRSQPAPDRPCHTLNSNAHAPAIAISGRARGDDGRGYSRPEQLSVDCAGTVDTTKQDRVWALGSLVRRLTPLECERLQGLPDKWTKIPWRNKPAELCPDSPRYRAIGNSMAVPVMRWIGERINTVNSILEELAA
jgi:DNA (cytosine-5)-methyltransferase 1